jgi:hypothetical protein
MGPTSYQTAPPRDGTFVLAGGVTSQFWQLLPEHRLREFEVVVHQVHVALAGTEVAGELGCDWHTVQDAVTLYGTALLAADRKRRSITSAIGLDETSFVQRGRTPTTYITTVADVANHQIVDLLPSRDFREVAAVDD